MGASLLDVSVLIALFDASHVHNRAARAWFARNGAAKWASCAITENGFIRVASRPGYPNFQPTPAVAAESLRQLKQETPLRYEFWSCDFTLADASRFDLSHLTSGRHSTDIYLAGIAHAHGGRFVTLDAKVPWQPVIGAGPELIETIAA